MREELRSKRSHTRRPLHIGGEFANHVEKTKTYSVRKTNKTRSQSGNKTIYILIKAEEDV